MCYNYDDVSISNYINFTLYYTPYSKIVAILLSFLFMLISPLYL